MTGRRTCLPACAQGRFNELQCFAALVIRRHADWLDTVMEAIQGHAVLQHVDRGELRESVLQVSPSQALDLAKLISAGSLLFGRNESLRAPDAERDDCLREVLRAVGNGAQFFTNHGHAEDGEDGDFLTSSFHADVLAGTTIDICLIGVSDMHVLVLWRFEDD
ncbi:hypothetical protein [Streptomyces sp. NPDC018610]|uniref:hypothetical protein n=1 Tax=Streptomyces sp. NPDC018610 TaxID=3365049 RepID=UPI0037B02758